jgi:hypothetical protein
VRQSNLALLGGSPKNRSTPLVENGAEFTTRPDFVSIPRFLDTRALPSELHVDLGETLAIIVRLWLPPNPLHPLDVVAGVTSRHHGVASAGA